MGSIYLLLLLGIIIFAFWSTRNTACVYSWICHYLLLLFLLLLFIFIVVIIVIAIVIIIFLFIIFFFSFLFSCSVLPIIHFSYRSLFLFRLLLVWDVTLWNTAGVLQKAGDAYSGILT